MFRNHSFAGALAFLCTILSAASPQPVNANALASTPYSATAPANSPPPQMPQITQPVNDSVRVQLTGNTDSTLVSGADLGAVADSLPMDHMWLQLRRSPASEQALDQLIDALHDPKSPSFHQWLTAEQFGSLYGPAQSDINTVVAWLESQGFTVNSVFPSGMLIEFSGTAADVRTAFTTQLHNYNVGGTTYLSNASDPSIPAALAPVVVGVVSLNNRFPHPLMHKRSEAANNPGAGMAKVLPAIPDFTFTDPTDGTFYAVAPGDFNTIYNVNPVWAQGITGLGQTIVVIEDTNIQNASDVTTFRTAFGLSGFHGTFTQVHPTGAATCTNPGVNGDEGEAALDAEWAGVAAPDANIELASCADAGTVFGGLSAAQNLLNSASPPQIMSVSYGECESANGAASNTAYVNTWQQAVAEGTTVFVSSGDEGAASCDANRVEATHGIAVSGFASTPYNVAVGGTDFIDFANSLQPGGPPLSTYWQSGNNATFASAISYVPEMPWDDSCANSILYAALGFTDGVTACNDATVKSDGYVTTGAGSGGPSNFSAKPSWQTGVVGIVADGKRDIPDVSLFAANGGWSHFLVFCLTDAAQGGAPSCDYTNTTNILKYLAAGGTSFAAPALAGIQALINQSSGQSWGNMNTAYYQLAAAEYGNSGSLSNCNASNGNTVGSSCIFYDITQGDIDVPCRLGTPNCFNNSAASVSNNNCNTGAASHAKICGVLSTSTTASQPAYPATQGWDFATGLGSVNVANLVKAMNPSTAFKLVYTLEPGASYASKAPITVKVSVENLSGTVLTGDTSTVMLALSGGTAGATLGGTLTANAVAGVATFSNVTVDKVGTNYVLNATDGSLLGATSSTFNITTGAASAISFSTSPSNAAVNTSITPAIVVHVQDAGGNAVSGDGVTLTIANNAGGAGTVLTGGGSVNTDSSGNATFSGVSLNKVGTSYTLTATDSSGTPLTVISSAFNITAGAAAQLVFQQQPTNTTAGMSISPAIVVHAQDAGGNAVSGDSITLTIANNAGGSTLTGGGSASTNVAGNAMFNDVSLNKIGTSYTLTATDSSGTPLTITSSAFNITAGAAAQLVFVQQPSNGTVGAAISPAITVQVQDANGNNVSSTGTAITLTANGPGPIASGGSANTASGLASFGSVVLNTAGSYTLTAASGALTAATSGTFTIGMASQTITFPNPPVQTYSPSGTFALGATASSGLTVSYGSNTPGVCTVSGSTATIVTAGNCSITASQAGDGNYNAATPVTDSITINMASQSITFNTTAPTGEAVGGPTYTPAATASSGLAVAFSIDATSTAGACAISAGVVSFTGVGNCIINANQAGDTNYNAATQVQQSVAVGIASQAIAFTSTAPSGATAGGTYIVTATASSSLPVALTIDAAATSVCSLDGNTTGSTVTYNGVGTCTIDADQAGNASYLPAPLAQQSFDVTPGAAAALNFTIQPSDTTAGVAISPAVQVSLVDAFGNLETGDSTHSVTLALAAGSDPSFNSGGAVTLSGGVATFPAITLTRAASGYELGASTDAGAFTATSNAFTVNPAAVVNLAFNPDPPSNTVAGVAIPGTETVTESDQYDNVVTTDNSSTISIVANGPGSLVASPVTATVSAGVASFNGDLILDKAGSYTLTASTSASALASATSQSFTVSAASGNGLQFTPAPGDILLGQSLGNVTVTEYDDFGNQILSDNSTSITLTAGSCGGTTLGTGVLTGGVVTIDSTLDFHTLATGVSLSATAAGSPAPKPATSTFNVGANGDFLFFSGFDACVP
jgi:subtilase family serine protease